MEVMALGGTAIMLRYKFSGSFSFRYEKVNGERGFSDFSNPQFSMLDVTQKDPKSSPYLIFQHQWILEVAIISDNLLTNLTILTF